jgi:hypothetical protein
MYRASSMQIAIPIDKTIDVFVEITIDVLWLWCHANELWHDGYPHGAPQSMKTPCMALKVGGGVGMMRPG